MCEDFENLYNKINSKPDSLTKADYAKLLVGSLVIVNNIKDRIKNEQEAIDSYNTTIIPKLQKIIDNAKTNEEVLTLSKEIFES